MGIREELDAAYSQMSSVADRIKELRSACKHPKMMRQSDYLGEVSYKCFDCDGHSYYEDGRAMW